MASQGCSQGCSQGPGLRSLLLGTPLGHREGEPSIEREVDMHLKGMIELMPRVYGNTEPCKQAVVELNAVVDMKDMMCKRAMLLYGMSKESAMCDHWMSRDADGSAALANDLQGRVLPFVVPRFFKHGCQCPDTFVVMVMVVSEMWTGENLGNWPHCVP